MKQHLFKLRRLPTQGRMLVQPGDKVSSETIVGEVDYIPGPLVRLNAAVQLGIASKRLESQMVKAINDKVEKGEPLAVSSEFYTRREVLSPVEGYVALWSKYLGYVYVREPLPTGPKEAIVLRAEDLGLSKLQFASDVRVKDNQVVNRGYLVIGGKQKFSAPALCRVKEVSLSEGYLTLAPLFQSTELPALLDGVVEALPEADSCRIISYGHRFVGAIGYGGERAGILRPILAESRELRQSDIPKDAGGRIVVARGGASLEALQKMAELQVAGLVLGCIQIPVLAEFSRQEPLKSLGLMMELPFPIVLLQGFGAPMPVELYAELALLQGMRAVIDGSTQLRAGVARPELLVVLPEETWPEYREEPKTQENLEIGAQVILVREPGFGEHGVVTKLDAGLKRTPAGTRAALATVLLADGRELQVPRNNCIRQAFPSVEESR